jgi:hypothetical protein
MLRLLLLALCALVQAAPASAVEVTTVTTPFVRADNALNRMRVDPKGRYIAYVGDDGTGLSVLDLKSKNIYRVSNAQIGASFFWSPDGFRVMYRELASRNGVEVESELKAYDCVLARSVTLEKMPFPTGILTFDPRDLRMHLMSTKGIRTKRIYFPDERLARWQVAQRKETGKWLATQGGILWVTQGGYQMRRMEDDGSALDSFDISPDGETIAWATNKGRVYTSKAGKAPKFIGFGRDPRWHPEKPQLVYAGARMVGNTAVSYDLRVSDAHGNGKFLTATQHSDERWPQWHPKGDQIIYTIGKSTDVFLAEFKQ